MLELALTTQLQLQLTCSPTEKLWLTILTLSLPKLVVVAHSILQNLQNPVLGNVRQRL